MAILVNNIEVVLVLGYSDEGHKLRMMPDFDWSHDLSFELFLSAGRTYIVFDLLNCHLAAPPNSFENFGRVPWTYFLLQFYSWIFDEVLLSTFLHLLHNKSLEIDKALASASFLNYVDLFDFGYQLSLLLQSSFLLCLLFNGLWFFFGRTRLIIEKVYELDFVYIFFLVFHRFIYLFGCLVHIIALVLFFAFFLLFFLFFHLRLLLACRFLFGRRFARTSRAWLGNAIFLVFFVNYAHEISKFILFLALPLTFFVKSIEILVQILMCEFHGFEDIFGFLRYFWFFFARIRWHLESEWREISRFHSISIHIILLVLFLFWVGRYWLAWPFFSLILMQFDTLFWLDALGVEFS